MRGNLQWRLAVAYVAFVLLVLAGVGLSGVILLSSHHAPIPVADALSNLLGILAVAAVVGSGLAVALAVALARSITDPLNRLTRMVRRLAKGNLSERVTLDQNGEVGDLVAAFADMAIELRRLIGGIEQQRAEVTTILSGMADGVMIVDEEDRVVALNRAAETLLDISESAARGSTVAQVTRRHQLVREVAENRATEEALVVELGRERRQVQVAVSPLDFGETSRRIFLFQDVTALRRAESVRRDFVANVSHELRTPLAALRALVETLEDGALEDPPAAREFLGRMHVEVDGLSQMVEELLELARIESGRVRFRFARQDLGQVVRQAALRLHAQAERQGVTLDVQTPAEPAEAVVDAERLQQVVINLVHNAIKFTPPGGGVTVRVEGRGEHVALVVADTGVGIAAGELPRLFERFYKADRSRATSGTGLGLAIVKHLVQAHHGQVWAESPGVGQGATFTVILPHDKD